MAPSRAWQMSQHVSAQLMRPSILRRHYSGSTNLLAANASKLPRVANPSFWSSLIPRFLRKPSDSSEAARRAQARDAGAEERRTGLIFLFLGILVGSNAINIIAIRREMLNYTRQTDAKLDLLREVVQKVKNGEYVDVKQALGTGDAEREKEWEQVMQELENTDMLWEGRKKRDAKRAAKAEERRIEEEAKNRARDAGESSSSDAAAVGNSPRPKFLM